MTSSYVNNLRLNEQGTGDNSGSWGTVTNLNLELIGQAFGFGTRAIANAPADNITIADGASDADRSMYLKLTGGGQACTVTFLPNDVSKVWLLENATSATLTFTQGSGANVAVLAGQVKMIATDGGGTDAIVYDLLTDVNLAGTTVTDIVTANQATVDDIGLNGKVITMTGSAGDTATLTVAADGALAIATTDAAAAAANISITADGTFIAAATTITLDSAGAIVLDADGGVIQFKDGGTTIGSITNSSSDLVIKSNVQDKDILLQGDDGGSGITALTLDMSAGGNALFSGTVTRDLTRGSLDVGNSSGVSAPLAAGTSGYFLKSDGTDAAWAEVVGSDSRQNYVADGNITARQAIFLKDTGKVSATETLKLQSRANIGSTGATPALQVGVDGYSKSANAYSTVDNVHVSIYLKGGWASGVNNAVVVVSQINADGSITSGADNNNAFGSSTYRSPSSVQMQYSSTINKFILFYTYKTSNANHYLRMAIGTLSGNAGAANKTFTLSNEQAIGSENTNYSMGGTQSQQGNYGGGLPGASGNMFFTPDGSNIKGFFFGQYCRAAESSGTVCANTVGFTVAANGTTAVSGFVPVTGGPASAGAAANLYGYSGTAHYHIPTNQWVLAQVYQQAGFIFMFTQGSGSTTISQITNDDKINFSTAGVDGQIAQFTSSTMQTIDNTHLYLYCATGPYKKIYRFTIGSTTITGGTGNDFTSLIEVNPSTGNIADYQPADAGWRYFSGFKAYRETGLGIYQGWCYQPEYGPSYVDGKKIIFSEFIFTGNDGALGFLTQSNYINSVSATPLGAMMINGHGSYDDERNKFLLLGWVGTVSNTSFAQNPLQKGVFSADFIGSGTTPIGIHDSSSTASSGATVSIGMFGSVIEGYSGLSVGETIPAANGKNVGYAISANKVMVTETN
tara:strand:+ start:1048 stop:3783 length:2736 start_codon:yes stop_codon:yes gene_type:complete